MPLWPSCGRGGSGGGCLERCCFWYLFFCSCGVVFPLMAATVFSSVSLAVMAACPDCCPPPKVDQAVRVGGQPPQVSVVLVGEEDTNLPR